jgi:hypothetical protein
VLTERPVSPRDPGLARLAKTACGNKRTQNGQSGMTVLDVSVTHPPGVAIRAASAATHGAAAARRDAEKRRAYNWLRMGTPGPLVPFSVETYGRLGKPAVAFLGMLGAEAMSAGDVSKSGFVAVALREHSVGLCKCNYLQASADASGIAWCVGWGCWQRRPPRRG